MKKITLLLSMASLLFVGLSSSNKEIETIAIGEDMPGKKIDLTHIDGSNKTLMDYKGEKGTLVIFSCNTCPFVIGGSDFEGWEKMYNDIHQVTVDMNIGSVLVNSNAAKREKGDNLQDMKERAEKQAYTFDYVLDKNSKLANEFGAKTTPHVFLFDANNKLVYEGQINDAYKPSNNNVSQYLISALRELSSGQKITTNKTNAVGCSIKRK